MYFTLSCFFVCFSYYRARKLSLIYEPASNKLPPFGFSVSMGNDQPNQSMSRRGRYWHGEVQFDTIRDGFQSGQRVLRRVVDSVIQLACFWQLSSSSSWHACDKKEDQKEKTKHTHTGLQRCSSIRGTWRDSLWDVFMHFFLKSCW